MRAPAGRFAYVLALIGTGAAVAGSVGTTARAVRTGSIQAVAPWPWMHPRIPDGTGARSPDRPHKYAKTAKTPSGEPDSEPTATTDGNTQQHAPPSRAG